MRDRWKDRRDGRTMKKM